MVALVEKTLPPAFESQDEGLLPLLDAAEWAVAARARIPVLSLWSRVSVVALFASHLHLKWPGRVPSLPLTPRIGLFPFFGSDLELLSQPQYQVNATQTYRQMARSLRFAHGATHRGDFYPDWEQAVDRRRHKLEHLVLPASSFISIDRVTEAGDIKPGHRLIIGKFAPRRELKPQLLVPARAEVTKQMVRAFDDLDLVVVNVQNIRGKQLARSIEYFLAEVSRSVPMLIVASSPADLVVTSALEPPSRKPIILCGAQHASSVSVTSVNQDRALVERQFHFAIEGLEEKSDLLARLVSQAKRAWWATRQSMGQEPAPEALAFASLYSDIRSRNPGDDVALLEEARRLIAEQSANVESRSQRRNAVIQAALHDGKSRSALVLTRSDAAADDLESEFASYLGINPVDLASLGVQVANVFGAWPTNGYDTCVATGYFGTATIDMLFASGADHKIMVVDPIEARIAVWDTEKRFCGVPDLPQPITTSLHSLSGILEPHACPSSEPVVLQSFFSDRAHGAKRGTEASRYEGKVTYVCVCFADGATMQVSANARFEVLGRKRLQLKTVTAKDLDVGDQVVLLHDDERAAFSEKLLRVMDEGRYKTESQTRSGWITTLRAVRSIQRVSAVTLKDRLEQAGIHTDVPTIRTWLPSATSEDCGVPEREQVFLALARAVGIAMPAEVLKDWFCKINRLRIEHRRMGRELVKAIRGAYLGRLDPVSLARMEREWGVQATALLQAARIAVVDDVIPFAE
ncbi:MAG: hypothetical protein U0Q18_32800 [Bryobacteraceae bacterium]